MNIYLDLEGEIDPLIAGLKDSPDKVSKATKRALSKLAKFAERNVLREVSRQVGVTAKLIKELGRVRASLKKATNRDTGAYELVVWLGIFDIPAHKLGTPRQTRAGVRTGKHFWQGAFLFQPLNAPKAMVFKRAANWKHKQQRSRKSGRLMWIGLPIEKQSLPIYQQAETALANMEPLLLERFSTLLQQELNYAFNIEPR